jgi:hypothetical protein
MKGYIAFTKDHSIHVGRLLVWPALLLACVLGIFVLVPIELILRSITHLDFPFALLLFVLLAPYAGGHRPPK